MVQHALPGLGLADDARECVVVREVVESGCGGAGVRRRQSVVSAQSFGRGAPAVKTLKTSAAFTCRRAA